MSSSIFFLILAAFTPENVDFVEIAAPQHPFSGFVQGNNYEQRVPSGPVLWYTDENGMEATMSSLWMNFEWLLPNTPSTNLLVEYPRRAEVHIVRNEGNAVGLSWPEYEGVSLSVTYCLYPLSDQGRRGGIVEMTWTAQVKEDASILDADWVSAMFASYVGNAKERGIAFPDAEGAWSSYGLSSPESFSGGHRGGALRHHAMPDLPFAPGSGNQSINLPTESHGPFVGDVPLYYGLIEANERASAAVLTVAVMLNCHPAVVRFAVWDWRDDPRFPAWDFHYLFQPAPGKAYQFVARTVLVEGELTPEQVMQVYSDWIGTITREDSTPPGIILNGGKSLSVNQGETYNDPGVLVAFDDQDGIITDRVAVSGSVNFELPGSYRLNFSVRDAAGNEASVGRTVTVEKVTVPTEPSPWWRSIINRILGWGAALRLSAN